MTTLTVGAFRTMAERACRDAGGSAAMARSLIDATLSAERYGRKEVGLLHFPDYLASMREGRLDGAAEPRFEAALPAFIACDAGGGLAQLGFDTAFDDLVQRARTLGLAAFLQRNSYTAGELGYYVRRLAQAGLVSIAVANAHAMMATAPGGPPVVSTNPMAFGVPLAAPLEPLVIDQASSATAFVNVARAAAQNRPIPEGWAVDSVGAATTDAAAAMLGALLPFGGYKGGNVALMVEMLSAGLSRASWSMDAGHFRSGDRCPAIGLTIIALCPPDAEAFVARATDQCIRWLNQGVFVPGARTPAGDYDDDDRLEIDHEFLDGLFPRRGF